MVSIGNSKVRRLAGYGPSARASFGIQTIQAGNVVLTPKQAAARIRMLRMTVRAKATKMLLEAAQPLVDQWKENIDAEGWGPNGVLGAFGSPDDLGVSEEEARRSGFNLIEGQGKSQSTGRYYDSIKSEVNDVLEVHVGSTIPRPSGRGLNLWSYPEILEYGSSTQEPTPTLGPAIEVAGPKMEAKTQVIFDAMLSDALMKKFHI